MAYIGNALTALIYAAKHRDDIVPDGVASTFELSQQVPGGYESNVIVFRRKYLLEPLVASTSLLSIDGTNEKIVVSDAALAAALSIVEIGNNLVISGASNSGNNGAFPITNVVYDGATLEIYVDGNLTTESGGAITLVRGRVDNWEVLEPETEYTIGGPLGPTYNKLITLSQVPSIDDTIYVIHQGDATYNFVPSQASVGPDQLSANLRNFVCDRYTGDGSTVTFALTQEAVNAKTLLVTVDGVESDGDDPDQSFTGAWQLDSGLNSITFHSAPSASAKIRILHLGFSTVSRRATLSPGQAGTIAPNSITTTQLANNSVTSPKIDDGAVTHSKLGADSVDGTNILLNNEEYLRAKGPVSGTHGLLKLGSDLGTVLRSPGAELTINIQDTTLLKVGSTAIYDSLGDGVIDLGKSSNKFKDAYFSGAVNSGSVSSSGTIAGNTISAGAGGVSSTGNISTTGDVSGTNGNFSNVNTTTINGSPLTDVAIPAGSIVMSGRTSAPTGWLLCDGSVVSQATYPALFSAIGSTYNIGGEGIGTFRVPDMRQRFPLGKAASGTGSALGAVGGAIDHTHIAPAHVHDMSNHFHNIPAHYHGMGTGATLNISSSGNHTTAIDHTHGTFNTSGGTPHTHGHNLGTDTAPNHSHSIDHDHGAFNSGGQSANHTHSIDHDHGAVNTSDVSNFHTHSGTTSADGSHTHTTPTSSGGSVVSSGSGGHPDKNNGASTGTHSNNAVGDHTHTFTTGTENTGHVHSVDIPNFTGSSGGTSQDHTHTIDVPNFTGSSGGAGTHSHAITTGAISTESAHTHSVNITTFTANSASNGAHSHPSTSFAGAIGNVSSGNDGNNTFLSGAPSTNNTGSAGALATTSNNPPYLVVNYIIKT